MKRFAFLTICLLLFAGLPAESRSETMYIRTIVKITLRTGPGIDHKIIRMIRSGQQVDVLEKGKEWSRIKIGQNQTGWVMTNLLTAAQPQLPDNPTGEEQTNLLDSNRELREENQNLGIKLSERRAELSSLRASFEAYKDGAEGFETLKSKYQALTQQFETQAEKSRQLEAAVADLQSQQTVRWLLAGAGVLFFGFIVGYSVKRQRRRSILR